MNDNEFTIQWHLTNKCNLSCKHCYLTKEHDSYDISLGDACQILNEIGETIEFWNEISSITKSVSFTGGEPFLYHDIFPLIKHANDNNFLVRILTNGSLVTKNIAKKIRDYEVHGVQVSIDNIEEEHNQFRGGENAFQESMRGIEYLIKEGVFVSISSTLTKFNSRKIGKLIDMSINIGASAIRFPRLVPIGNGLEMTTAVLSAGDLKEAYILLCNKQKELEGKIDIILDDPLFTLISEHSSHCTVQPNNNTICPSGCSVGFTGICIDQDGTFLPCRKLPIPIGNWKEKSFRDIWINSKVLNDIRNNSNLKGNCYECEYGHLCKGCRAIAYSLTGDYLSGDDQCWLTH